MIRTLSVRAETFPMASAFRISRGSRTEAHVVVAEIEADGERGRGESGPYPRYGETVEGVVAAIEALRLAVEGGIDRQALRGTIGAGAARNAVDCALFDLEAKLSGRTAASLAGLPPLAPVTTAVTVSLGTAEEMAEATRALGPRSLVKIKLGGKGDPERIAAVRAAAPDAAIIADANEAWDGETFAENMAAAAAAGVALVEQPLPAGEDALLAGAPRPVPVCADESAHVTADLRALRGRYDAVNIKLDKAGGLTEALEMKAAARAAGFQVMVGCMVGTSLAMAPAVLIAQGADFVDLDGPLLLARDRDPGLVYEGSTLLPPDPALWG